MYSITRTLSFLSLAASLHAFSVKNLKPSSRIVFGTAAISQAEDPFQLLDAAFEKGVRRFDLARTYGQGKSETVFGEWMESRYVHASFIFTAIFTVAKETPILMK